MHTKFIAIVEERIEYLRHRLTAPFIFNGNRDMTATTLALNEKLLKILKS
jgi:hypothetical protein